MALSQNRIWQFFASVKLALAALIVLSMTSIIGTLIEQNKGSDHYIEKYGATLAQLFELLDFTSMYNSWWFISLLFLFALNLVVCSIERLPGVWHTVAEKNPEIDAGHLKKMAGAQTIETRLPVTAATELVQKILADNGWKKFTLRSTADSVVFFVQQGAWTRLAVYVVHLSILIILAGAIIGTLFGFKAFVYLPEGRSTENVYRQGSREPIPLDFQVRGDSFRKSFYANGMVKQHHADLTVIDPKRDEPYRKSIFVNDPLSYGGLSFYMGDSFPIEEYSVIISNRQTGAEQIFRVPPQQDFSWPEGEVTAHIKELIRDADGNVQRARISLSSDPAKGATESWIDNNSAATMALEGEEFILRFRQLSSVLLLANKDPGVNIVFAGFLLMMAGLFVSFFLSHRRVWINLSPTKKGTLILLGGSANKNKPGFEKAFHKLTTSIEENS